MLSNKLYPLIIILFLSFLISCGDTEEKKKAPAKDYSNPSVQLEEARKLLGDDVKVTFLDNFDEENESELIAASEINSGDQWGIKFTSIDISGEPQIIFETDLLDGSLEDSRVEKLNLPGKNYKLIYYNSADFFMGSGGGEVFSYIIEFNEREVYYSHLVADAKKVSLYLSDNINNDEVRQYFLNTFKRDFPSFVLVQQDVVLDE